MSSRADGEPAANERLAATPFSRLAVAHALTVAGDTLVTIALAGSLFFDISPSAARGKVALSLALTMTPFAVVAPLLGPAIDRARGGRRMMVVVAAGGRAITVLVMARVVDGLFLFPAAFSSLVLSKAHSVAKSALVPGTVEGVEDLVEANAKLALGSVVVGFVTAAPGIVVLKVAGAAWVLRLAAVLFSVAAVAALRIQRVRTVDGVGLDATHHAEVDRSAPGRDRTTRVAALATSVLRGAVGFLTFLLAFYLRRDHAPSWWFGIAVAASMGGTFVGTVLAPRVRRRVGEERIITASLVFVAVVAALAARGGGRVSAGFLAGSLGAAAAAGKLAFDALVQRQAGEGERGRWIARFETWFQLAWVAGAFVPVLVPIGLDVGFLVLAAAASVAAAGYPLARRAGADAVPG